MEYNPRQIERKWNKWWEEREVYKVSNPANAGNAKPKYYILDMFPYPSGSGLHVGHPLGYIASDILARYKRMHGFNVLHPMGFDAFGLPAEQFALQTGVHPAVSTAQNIERYRQQLKNLGLCYDWSREVQTCDPGFYKWTQWIFLQLFSHYYCNDSQKARPIEELTEFFSKKGNAEVNAACSQDTIFSAAEWNAMTPRQQSDILMNYRLAYKKETFVWWCEALGTVLANDEVKDGVSERGGYPVERKPMLQWSLRITAYAERLLNDLDEVEFSDAMKKMQSNWIGKSQGAQLFFQLDPAGQGAIEIFTTRPDTIFGATFMVLAPEHDLVKKITTPEQAPKIEAYLNYVNTRSERDRMAETKEVTGEFTGAFALNPFTQEKIPVWIAEYVLKDYGTGAIMAVPADDDRDLRFAKKFNLPIVDIIDKNMYPGATIEDKVGKMINSGFLDGMEVADAIETILQKIEQMGIGHRKINYKLRDAIFSRQRYWGEPFPIVYDPDGVAHPLPDSELPLELPPLDDFRPSSGAQAPLARVTHWVELPNGWRRETDTMPGFAGSSWYYLRYMDARNDQEFASQEAIRYWQDVDIYIGGTEHAVGHLMYSRFWHKFLYDKGLVPTKEPYRKLINQGMIQGKSAIMQVVFDNNRTLELRVPVHLVDEYWRLDLDRFEMLKAADNRFEAVVPGRNVALEQDEFGKSYIPLTLQVEKMSKSLHNVVNPDEVVEQYGADCFRLYEMFLGPIDQAKPWDTKGINGVASFLRRLWALFYDENGNYSVTTDTPVKEDWKALHTCLKKVNEDVGRFSFNTCISAFMICVNELRNLNCSKRPILESLVKAIAPFAPHLAEELWHVLGHDSTVFDEKYPVANEAYLVQDNITYPVSINGKKRALIELPANATEAEVEKAALETEVVKKWIDGLSVKKVIVVSKRMVNIVVG